jgi:hypothetical protein
MKMRGIGGVIAGLVAGILVAMLASFIGGLMVGTPAGVDMSNATAIRNSYASLTTAQQLVGILSWAIGALAGAYVAKKIAGRSWAAWTVAVLMAAYQLLGVFVLLPMPAYLQVLAIALPLVAGYIANRMVPERAPVHETPASDDAEA